MSSARIQNSAIPLSWEETVVPDLQNDSWIKIVLKVIFLVGTGGLLYGVALLLDAVTSSKDRAVTKKTIEEEIDAKIRKLQKNSRIKPSKDFVEENFRLSLPEKIRPEKGKKLQDQDKKAAREAMEEQFLKDLHRLPLFVNGQSVLVGDNLVPANGNSIRIRGSGGKFSEDEQKAILEEFQIRFGLKASSDEWPRLLPLLQQAIFFSSFEELVKEFIGNPLEVASDGKKYCVFPIDHQYGFIIPEEDGAKYDFSTTGKTITASKCAFICDGSSKKPLARVQHTTIIHLKNPKKNAYSFELRPLVKEQQPEASA